MDISEQRARDEIAFDGFPPSDFVTLCEDHIKIRVNYSEKLSATIRNIGGGKWHPDKAEWRFPFATWRRVAAATDVINALAVEARQQRQAETEAREAERRRQTEERQREADRKDEAAAMNRPRRIKSEHVTAAERLPLFHLIVESIGDLKAMGLDLPIVGLKPRAYVGQIMGHDGRRFLLAYLQGNRDYARANSRGSRGIYISYLLAHGPIYKVSAPISWSTTDRYFCRVENGSIVKMTEAEVMQCLES